MLIIAIYNLYLELLYIAKSVIRELRVNNYLAKNDDGYGDIKVGSKIVLNMSNVIFHKFINRNYNNFYKFCLIF